MYFVFFCSTKKYIFSENRQNQKKLCFENFENNGNFSKSKKRKNIFKKIEQKNFKIPRSL